MSTPAPSFLAPLLLSLLPSVGNHRYHELVNHFGSAQQALGADNTQLKGLHKPAKALIHDYQNKAEHSQLMQSAKAIIDACDSAQGHIVSIECEAYPALLKTISQAPPVLFIKGQITNLHLPQLAIVGSRHATYRGLENTRLFSRHLSQSGFTITSGLALGVDGAAHQAALCQTANTIAVMATGINSIYPKQHRKLADQILAENGTLVTEFIPSTPPKADHFPRRNRVISGLSLGVIVVEAAVKSGSLITAQYALEQGREVFAIPGSIHNPQSKGCHQLIKNGANLVENSQDIVEQLQGMLTHCQDNRQAPQTPTTHRPPLSENEQKIIDHIGYDIVNTDSLIQSTQLPIDQLSACLTQLEITGRIKRTDWGYELV